MARIILGSIKCGCSKCQKRHEIHWDNASGYITVRGYFGGAPLAYEKEEVKARKWVVDTCGDPRWELEIEPEA